MFLYTKSAFFENLLPPEACSPELQGLNLYKSIKKYKQVQKTYKKSIKKHQHVENLVRHERYRAQILSGRSYACQDQFGRDGNA